MSSFNTNTRNLTNEEQRILTMNINQYEQVSNHIDFLFDMLDDIRGNIIYITQTRNIRNNRNNRNNRNSRSNINNMNTNAHTNTNINRIVNQLLNNRYYNFMNYDYERPINSYYNGINTNTHRNNNNNYEFTQNSELPSFINNFLNSTVIIRPTPEQIQNASVLIRYSDIENPLAEYCPISLDEFNDDDQVRQIIHCGHIFHQNPFQQWFQNNSRCPICRYDIRNYTPLSSNTNNQQPNQPSLQVNRPSEQSNQSSEQINQNIPDTSSTLPISNINLFRDPISNQIEQFSFDIIDQQFTNSFLDQIARTILQSTFHNTNTNTNTNTNNDDRFMIDSSNNILFFETIIRPNRNTTTNRNINSNDRFIIDPSNNVL